MKKNINKKEYAKEVDIKSPKSKCFLNFIKAFIIGGIICAIGQIFLNYYKTLNLSEEMTGAIEAITMIFIGVLLTGLNIYPKIAKHAGAGTLVPITGFANSIASPAIEFKSEGLVLGVGAKLFQIAGPVLVYGISTSMIIGLLYFLFNGQGA